MGNFVGRIMAHGISRLSARTVETAKSSGLIADGGGLYLQVSKSGAKSWLYRFMLNGRPLHVREPEKFRHAIASSLETVNHDSRNPGIPLNVSGS